MAFGRKVSFQDSAYAWAHSIIDCSAITIDIIGREHLGKQAVYIVNHRSSADIYVLLEIMHKHSVFVFKHELLNHPLIGLALRISPYIPVDRSSPRKSAQAILKAKSLIEAGYSIIIFPEGTWSYPPHDILPFKQGALYMANKTGLPIIPVAMSGTETITRPDGIMINSGMVKVHVGPPQIAEKHEKDQAEYLRNIMQDLLNQL